MNILLILAAIVIVTSLAVAFISLFTRTGIYELISRLKCLISLISHQHDTNESSTQPDLSVLNCRAQLIKQEGNNDAEIFQMEICGSIHTPSEETEVVHANLKISILDITEGVANAQSVQTRIKDEAAFNKTIRPEFSYNTDLGKLPHQITTLSDWTVVAKLPVDLLMFPRKGQRK